MHSMGPLSMPSPYVFGPQHSSRMSSTPSSRDGRMSATMSAFGASRAIPPDGSNMPATTWLSQTRVVPSRTTTQYRSRAAFGNGALSPRLSPREKGGARGAHDFSSSIVPHHQGVDRTGTPMRGVRSYPYGAQQTAYVSDYAPQVAAHLVHPYQAITETNANSVSFNIISGSACERRAHLTLPAFL